MPDLGKAYVQIVPSAKGMSGNIKKELEGSGADSGGGFGGKFASMAKKVIAAAAIGKFVKDSLDAGGALQQSFGGLDTLYGDAAAKAKEYAMAAQEAGISANTYAEQAVSFGAALKQAYGGDTQKAMEAANTAILDMADNSSKFGTDIQAVQNAYQGFAKGNYTMLDNLKLGYGGTKTEMERLLADAEKLPAAMGRKFDLSNLGDVYDAIHLIQDDLGVAGVAADEAKTTFTGSFASMKAAAENLMASFSLGMDISAPLQALVTNAKNFLIGNLLPMIGNILKQIPMLLSESQSIGQELIKNLVTSITSNAPQLVQSGADLLVNLIQGMISNAALLLSGGLQIITALANAMKEVNWAQIGNDILTALKDGLTQAADMIFGEGNTLEGFFNSINEQLPDVLNKGIEIITNLVNGAMSALPEIISMAGDLIIDFANGLMNSAPLLLEQGVQLIVKLVEGIANGLPEIATKAGEVIGKFVEWTSTNLPQILELGIRLTGELASGLIRALPKIVEAVLNLIKAIVEKFKTMDWKTIGQNILAGIVEGLKSFISMVVSAAKECAQKVIDAFKDFFGIHSPSTKMMELAKDLIQGLINGIKNMAASAASTMLQLSKSLIEKLNPSEWIERGKELGQKLGEGIGNAKETVSNKIGELADAARNTMNGVDLTSTGAAIGNSIANGIKSAKTNVTNQMDALINAISGKGQEAQNKINAIQYAATHAHLNGSVGTAEMYGAAGDTLETEEEAIVNLLEKYLPIIASKDNSYNQLNREFGWAIQ